MINRLFQKGATVLQQKQSNVLAAAWVMIVCYGCSMILGMISERLLVGYFFGCCSEQLDVYYAAFRIPDTLFQLLVTGALSAAFIPVFSQTLQKSETEAYKLAATVLNGLLGGFGVLAVVTAIFAPQLSRLITGDFNDGQIALMAHLTRILLLSEACLLLSGYLTGILQSYQRFLASALAPVVYNLGIIAGIIWLAPRWGIYGPVWGVVIGAALHALIQVPALKRVNWKYFWIWDFKKPAVKEMLRLMLPRTISLGVNQMEITGALWFVTSLSSGSLVLFNLAETLMQLPVRLLGVPMSQAAFPALSKMAKEKHQFGEILIENLLQILYLVLPLTTILLILRIPIVRLVYGAATFPWQATVLTGRTLGMFVLAIPAQAMIQLLVRGFYAQKDTKTPLVIGLVSVGMYLGLSYVFTFVFHWGLLGVAGATSLASLVQWGLLLEFLNKKVGLVSQQLVVPIVKLLATTLLMAVCLWILMRELDKQVFDTTRVLPLIALTVTVTATGLAVYLGLCHWLEVGQQDTLLKLFYRFPMTKKGVEKIQTWAGSWSEVTRRK